MLLTGDFDPNSWRPSRHEFRIYGDDLAQRWALVDAEDYWFFSRWRWTIGKSNVKHRRKEYVRRNMGSSLTLYLHVEIMKRIEPAPSPAHVLVDHMNGKSLDCRRSNLRWATISENNRNLFGSFCAQSTALF